MEILLVEDSPISQTVLRDMLEGLGHHVTLASNGRQALTMAKSEKPDLILLDVLMPGMDGFELSKKLKEDQRTSHIPIIMLTAKGRDVEKEKGRAVTIMGDKEIPYALLKRIMTPCADNDYRNISLAVNQVAGSDSGQPGQES